MLSKYFQSYFPYEDRVSFVFYKYKECNNRLGNHIKL